MLETFLLAFVPLFVAMDAFGTFPLFITMTEDETQASLQRVAGQATLTAMIVGTAFLFGGQAIMRFLSITINDFRVAGGVILLCFAVYDLLFSHLQRSLVDQGSPGDVSNHYSRANNLAIVPLGIPLIVGPAALTALLLLAAEVGPFVTVLAFATNILLVYLLFRHSRRVVRHIPQQVLRAASKVVALFLAAIAVMMMRTGLTAMFGK